MNMESMIYVDDALWAEIVADLGSEAAGKLKNYSGDRWNEFGYYSIDDLQAAGLEWAGNLVPVSIAWNGRYWEPAEM